MAGRCLFTIGLLCLLSIESSWATGTPSAGPPNIVFIVADDLGWQDVGFMGSKYFETPHLDALANQSLTFSQAYMYPTCSPSRTALATGKQSFRTGSYCVPVLERGSSDDNLFSRWTIGTEHTFYAEPLSKAGYELIHLGKWHLVGPHPETENALLSTIKLTQPKNGELSWLAAHRSQQIRKYYPTGRGFHENVGGTWWGDPARGHTRGYRAPGGGYAAPFKNPFIPAQQEDEWLTDRLTSEAIDFIAQRHEGSFFVNLHFYAPHRPSVPRHADWLAHYMEKKGDPSTGQGLEPDGEREEIAAYATMIRSIDENVGRIIDCLEQAGLRENTVVIFTSDNGFNSLQSCNKNLRGAKGAVYEGGIRVPALFHWPGTVSPGRHDAPIHAVDYFPTFLELAGISEYGGTLDGDSLVPLLRGNPFPDRALFWHVASTYKHPPCSVIRRGNWKLIQYLQDGKTELYNLGDDLKESRNLTVENPEQTQALLQELVAWRKSNRVPLPPSSQLKY